MAKYLPDGWTPSAAASREFTAKYDAIKAQIGRIANKFKASYPSREDFEQEGMIAALFAVDTYTPNKGKLEAYIQTIAYNAMAMVYCEVHALRRTPKVQESDGHGGLSKGAPFVEFNNDLHMSMVQPASLIRDEEMDQLQKRAAGRLVIDGIKAKLTPEAQTILDLKMNTPIELHVLSRNLHGRNKLTNQALSRYTGLTISRVEKSLREIRQVVRSSGLVQAHV